MAGRAGSRSPALTGTDEVVTVTLLRFDAGAGHLACLHGHREQRLSLTRAAWNCPFHFDGQAELSREQIISCQLLGTTHRVVLATCASLIHSVIPHSQLRLTSSDGRVLSRPLLTTPARPTVPYLNSSSWRNNSTNCTCIFEKFHELAPCDGSPLNVKRPTDLWGAHASQRRYHF